MTEPTAEPRSGAATFDLDAYHAFVAGLELQRVEAIEVRAARSGHGDMVDAEVEVDSAFAVDPARHAVFYKFDISVQIAGEDDVQVGEAEATLVLVFRAETTDVPVEMVDHFGGTSATTIAQPYLRETVTSLAARVGFPGLLLPLARR